MNQEPSTALRTSTSKIVQFSVERIFSIPIGFVTWNDYVELNDDLRCLILEKARVEEGVPLSEAGGWHSRNDLFSWPHAVVARLQERIERSVVVVSSSMEQDRERPDHRSWSILSWANVMQHGHHVDVHHHAQYEWAGVYYVDAGDKPQQGDCGGIFEIRDPASQRLVVACRESPSTAGFELEFKTTQSNEQFFSIIPEEGLMIIFPGSVCHRVTAYSGTRPRISISFNASR